MAVTQLARRYASALMEIASEKAQVENVLGEMKNVIEVAKQNEFMSLLKNPVISIKDKQQVFQKLFPQVSEMTQRFFDLVLKRKREAVLPEMARAFIEEYQRSTGTVEVVVTSAVPLGQEELQKTKEKIQGLFSKPNIELITKVDPSIIGGIIIDGEGKRLDESVSAKIQQLRKKFVNN